MAAQNRFCFILRTVVFDSRIAGEYVGWVALQEQDIARLDGDVGAGADGDTQVGLGQRRSVVHTGCGTCLLRIATWPATFEREKQDLKEILDVDRVATLPSPRTAAPHHDRTLFGPVAWVFAPLVQHRRAWLALNAAYFGIVALAACYAALNPPLQQALLETVGQAFSPTGSLGPLVTSYIEGQLATAIALTFVVNLVLGSAVVLTLPSLIIPFAGVAAGLYRAFLWGILFSPTPASALGASTVIALPTILVEGEAYVIAMLGVWVWWSSVVRTPGRRLACWKDGLLLQVRIYPAVMLVLALAATYEAASVVLILR